MNDLMTRSFLNYVDLKKHALRDLQSEVLSQKALKPEDEENLSFFFQEVEQINTQMGQITMLLQDLQALNEETKSINSSKVLHELRDRIDSDTTAISRKVMAVKSQIEALSKSNIESHQSSVGFEEGRIVDRTRMTITNSLKCRLKEMMRDFATLRDRIVDDHKEELTRKCYRSTGETPTEEIVDKMVSGSMEMDMIQVGKTKKMGFDSQCKERHEAVLDIKRSLDRLRQVFLDMAVLVEEQEEQIDDIEKNMASSGQYIYGGTNNLYYAKQKKKTGKKRVYWVWVVVLIILLVCLVAALAS